jgi:Tfp pilus assembly protein PilZ
MTDSIRESDDSGITARLNGLIKKMSEPQKRALLKMLEDWQHTHRRGGAREPCFLAVDYATQGRVFKDFVRNVSSTGVFIETSEPFTVGEEITLTFSSGSDEGPVKITGEIVRSGSGGIGVRFKTAKPELEQVMKSL